MTGSTPANRGVDDLAVSFVVPVRNDAVRLRRCLESLLADAADTPHEIIVMDHGSTDDSVDTARRLGARTVSRASGTVATLRNDGVSLARAPLVAFVDADHQISRGWLAAALAALAAPEVGAVGAPYHAPADGTWVQRAYDGFRRHPTRTEPAEWFGAGNLVVRRAAFDAVGGFDTGLESCEDVDLCFRFARSGWTLLSVPAMHSVHHGDPPTLGRLFWSELWRGRDNLRVSLRGPRSLTNIVSTLIPVVELGAFVVALAGLVTGFPLGRGVGLLALAVLLGLIALRTFAILRNARVPGGVPAAFAVAATYDAGRALALVARAGHHRRVRPAAVTTS